MDMKELRDVIYSDDSKMERVKINKLPERYEDIILSLFAFNNKLVLAGSLGLYILDIFDPFNRDPSKYNYHYHIDKSTADFDFGLIEKLTLDEINHIRDFFGLQLRLVNSDYDSIIYEDNTQQLSSKSESEIISERLNQDLIQLDKFIDITDSQGYGYKHLDYTIDFFNKEYLKPKDYIEVDYFGIKIKITHPSITLSHKAKYAYDIRVGKQMKHWIDINNNIDWVRYFFILKHIKISEYAEEEYCRYYFDYHQPSHLDLPF